MFLKREFQFAEGPIVFENGAKRAIFLQNTVNLSTMWDIGEPRLNGHCISSFVSHAMDMYYTT